MQDPLFPAGRGDRKCPVSEATCLALHLPKTAWSVAHAWQQGRLQRRPLTCAGCGSDGRLKGEGAGARSRTPGPCQPLRLQRPPPVTHGPPVLTLSAAIIRAVHRVGPRVTPLTEGAGGRRQAPLAEEVE